MATEKIYKVLANMAQGLTEAEQEQGRNNLGIYGSSWLVPEVPTPGGNLLLGTDASGMMEWIPSSSAGGIQPSQLSSYIHAGNANITVSQEPSYINIFGANADWDASSGEPGFIEHRPDLSIYQPVLTAGDNIDITGNVISATAAPQVNADWDASSGVAEVLNKPSEKTLVAGQNISITESGSQVTIASTSTFSQAQADWTQTSQAAADYIKHKPAERGLAGGDNITIIDNGTTVTISSTAGGADWDAASGDPGYIANKPTIPAALSAGDGIAITSNVISRKVQFVTPSSTYSAIRHVLDEGDVPVLDVANGSYHNYFFPTHKSGEHVDFVGSMGYSTYPTYEAANYFLKYSIDNYNAWTVSKYHELPYFAAADAYKTLRVNSSGNGVEWTVDFPAVQDLNGLQTYTVTADDVANGYALVPAFQLPYASKESTVSLAADLIAFDLLRSNAHLYFAGVTKFEAFLGTSNATKGYMFRRVESPATTVSDSGAALTEAADMWRWHLVHNGGRNTSDVTHLLIKAYIDSSVQVGDQFSWEGGLVQFNA